MILKRCLVLTFFSGFMVMWQSAVAGDIMFGPLQFRATVGSMPSSAAYVSIMNQGKISDRLLGANSNLARKTELHTMDIENGLMKMRQVEGGIDIPAGETIHLKPGGYHVMLIGLNGPLKANRMFEITFWFQYAGKKIVKGMAMLPADLQMGDPSKMHNHKHKTH